MRENYTDCVAEVQLQEGSGAPEGCLVTPSGLTRFRQISFSWTAELVRTDKGRRRDQPCIREIPAALLQNLVPRLLGDPHWLITQCYRGVLEEREEDRLCPHCGHPMHVHSTSAIRLQHVPSGHMRSEIEIQRKRYVCPNDACSHKGKTVLAELPFEAAAHRMTVQLHNFIVGLCELGLTQKLISMLTGVDRHIIRAIDKARLEQCYTEVVDGRRVLKKPEQQALILGIDEFKLHNGQEYATVIMDMDSGHVLWLQHSKKKQVVYDFIEHVGLEWMQKVQAICADMNADFAAAFREKCPHLEVVYDRFHIVKNFNEMVIGEVRKDEYRRLQEEGNPAAAKLLKGSKYILASKRSTLQEKDQQAAHGKVLRNGSDLFQIPEVHRTGGKEEWYDELLEQNELLFTADYVKEQLNAAYQQTDRTVMEADVREIIAVCRATQNIHFGKFANLLENHLDGITSHADYPRSSGKVEGTNNRIKTIRRQAYGYRDDTYFFLKIIDSSYHRSSQFVC